jgi:hypothetical protein
MVESFRKLTHKMFFRARPGLESFDNGADEAALNRVRLQHDEGSLGVGGVAVLTRRQWLQRGGTQRIESIKTEDGRQKQGKRKIEISAVKIMQKKRRN